MLMAETIVVCQAMHLRNRNGIFCKSICKVRRTCKLRATMSNDF